MGVVDNQNAVYGTVQSNSNVHFDSDSLLPLSNQKRTFIVKYDTLGNFKWLRMPTPDTVKGVVENASYPLLDMIVHKNGNFEVFAFFLRKAGPLGNTTNIHTDTAGTHILYYDAQGEMKRIKHVPGFGIIVEKTYFTSIMSLRFGKMPNGNYIIAGENDINTNNYWKWPFYLNGQPVKNPVYVAAFDSSWNYLWHRTINDTLTWCKLHGRPRFDNQNNIYISGLFGGGFKFHTHLFVNTFNYNYAEQPAAVKLDAAGNVLWGVNASLKGGVGYETNAYDPVSNTFYLASIYGRQTQFGAFSLQNNYNVSGLDMFLAAIDGATGTVLAIDTINSLVAQDENPTAMVVDHRGNVYVGMRMGGSLTVAGDTIWFNGGGTDILVAKFGTANCNSSVVPLKLMTFVASWLNDKSSVVRCRWQTAEEENTAYFIVQRSYDGKNFINVVQVAAKGTPSNDYTYTDEAAMSGAGNAKTVFYRLLMYDKDGRYDVSRTISLTRSVDEAVIHIAPNPAKDRVQLSLSGEGILAPAKLLFYDMYGRVVKTISLTGGSGLSIPVSDLANGTYFIHLSQNGKTVAKEKLVVSR